MNALLGDVMAGLKKISMLRRSKPLFVADVPPLALLTLDGIVAGTVVEGSMTRDLFLEYLKFVSYTKSWPMSLTYHLTILIFLNVCHILDL